MQQLDEVLNKDNLLGLLFQLQAQGMAHGFSSNGEISQKYYAQAQIITMLIDMIMRGDYDYVSDDTTIN